MFTAHDIVKHHLYGVGRVLSTGYRCALVRFRNGMELMCWDENLKLLPY